MKLVDIYGLNGMVTRGTRAPAGVATDNDIDKIDFEGTTVVFVGVLEGVNIIENTMVIKKDCCHISLTQGETELILNLE